MCRAPGDSPTSGQVIPPANLPSKFPFQITFKIRRFPQQITLKITFSNNLQTFLQISCRKSGVEIPQNEIYNIGTEILYFQCLNCLQTRLFCKSIIPEDSGITRRALSNASVKTRFKAFWDISSKICMRPWIRRHPFSWTFAPGGRLSYEAYKVTQNINAECQTEEYKVIF